MHGALPAPGVSTPKDASTVDAYLFRARMQWSGKSSRISAKPEPKWGHHDRLHRTVMDEAGDRLRTCCVSIGVNALQVILCDDNNEDGISKDICKRSRKSCNETRGERSYFRAPDSLSQSKDTD